MLKTEKVLVREVNDGIQLIPVADTEEGCPLRGMCSDGKISSYSFMNNKQAEKELEL